MHTQTQAQIPGSEASRGLALHALAHRAHQICPARNAWGDEYPHTFILSLMLPSNTRINAEPHLVHMIRLIVALEWGQVVVLPPRSSCRRGHACRQHLQVLFVVSRLLSPSQLVKENEKASQQNKKKKKKKKKSKCCSRCCCFCTHCAALRSSALDKPFFLTDEVFPLAQHLQHQQQRTASRLAHLGSVC